MRERHVSKGKDECLGKWVFLIGRREFSDCPKPQSRFCLFGLGGSPHGIPPANKWVNSNFIYLFIYFFFGNR